MKKSLRVILLVLALVLIDQSIKIYIYNNLMNKEFYIFDSIFGFKPIINTKYSYFNSFGNMGIGLITHIVLNIVMLFLILIIFYFIKERYSNNKIIYCLFVLVCAAAICSLIDKVFWGGSLDFISFKNFFIFDLKDVYISVFEIVTMLCVILNYKKLEAINEKTIYNDFKSYIKLKCFKK
ncbi:signal peptidase II [Clostridium botulinum]|uniref:signal peptidase II n=1 Tax=Clostridium botulinum TaxID=1491 RepID=UPI00016B98B9|nr:signal peptidase II [Clostridium botulinum]APC81621.1 signal peptidase (SPase) II family protein [Clostridium botulinum]APC83581.1 signal peptidase (SPase) II family protein [Clostridium botulinum]AXG95666.1 signal peptidase II [Clostridium botulinum]EDT82310.1 signal peptidase [Clostridium botulinum NCTC 2916]MBY6770792.1 signal peptidase II [Clostridium botulinum]